MTVARPVFPNSMLMVNRRCARRQFLLRPDEETNNAFLYCLIVAAQRFDMPILGFVQMSNHLHNAIYDRLGSSPEFYGYFHTLLAKCMNCYRGRWENFFSSEQPCVVRLATREDLIRRLVYIAMNPVKADLVERALDWPGQSSYGALINGTKLRATRPKFFFADDGTMPDSVELEIRIPPELGDHDEIVAIVKARVEQGEQCAAECRAWTGKRVLGARAVLRQSWRGSPRTHEERRGIRPTIGARSAWARIEAMQRNHEFRVAYAHASKARRAGVPIPFPPGTYWLRRFQFVQVAQISN